MYEYFHAFTESWDVPVEPGWLADQEPLGCQCGRVLYPRVIHPQIRDPETFSSICTSAGSPPKKIGGKMLLLREDIIDAIGTSIVESVFHIGLAEVTKKNTHQFFCLIEKEPCLTISERSEVCLLFSRCSECSKPLYAYSSDACYIVGVRLEHEIYVNETKNSLFLRADVAQRIKSLGIKEIILSRVVFTDESPDGLPVDLSHYAGVVGGIKRHHELKKPKRRR